MPSKAKPTSKTPASKPPASKALASKALASKAAVSKAAVSKAASKATKLTKSAPPTPVLTKTVEPVVTETAAEAVVTPPLHDEFASILSRLQQVNAIMTSVRGSVRDLEKKTAREIKAALKAKAKNRKGNRAPSGFVMPAKISDELAMFLGKEQGSEMARTEVTREINAYIRAHNLQDSKNGRIINADASLTKLLKLDKEDELTYFNLQRYMSPHFAKAVKKEVATA